MKYMLNQAQHMQLKEFHDQVSSHPCDVPHAPALPAPLPPRSSRASCAAPCVQRLFQDAFLAQYYAAQGYPTGDPIIAIDYQGLVGQTFDERCGLAITACTSACMSGQLRQGPSVIAASVGYHPLCAG